MNAHDPLAYKPLSVFVSFPTFPFTDWLPNGDGLVAYTFVSELIARGHRVHVATPWADLQSAHHPRMIIHKMHPDRRPNKLHRVRYMVWSRKLLQRIKSAEHIDLIHELNPVFMGLSLSFAGLGLPVVLGPHSSRWPGSSRATLWKRTTTRIASALKDTVLFCQHRGASAILLSTPAALDNVHRPEHISDRLFVVPPGIDAEYFIPATAPVTTSTTTVLFLANVLARKGIFTLLEAFTEVKKRVPAARLRIAGDGPEIAKVRSMVGKSGFAQDVDFVGRVERSQVPSELQGCTVYCLPSFGEPFGMTALEAMSCGKPLVVTETGGLGYLVSPNGGRLVPEGDPGELANSLIALLRDETARDHMGHFNRQKVQIHYAWPVIGHRLEMVYHQVLGTTGPGDFHRVTPAMIDGYKSKRDRLMARNRTQCVSLVNNHRTRRDSLCAFFTS